MKVTMIAFPSEGTEPIFVEGRSVVEAKLKIVKALPEWAREAWFVQPGDSALELNMIVGEEPGLTNLGRAYIVPNKLMEALEEVQVTKFYQHLRLDLSFIDADREVVAKAIKALNDHLEELCKSHLLKG